MFKVAAILKFFKSHLLQYSKSDCAETKGGIVVAWRFKIAKSFSSNIQDCNHGGNLETLHTASGSKLLNAIWSDSRDGRNGTI